MSPQQFSDVTGQRVEVEHLSLEPDTLLRSNLSSELRKLREDIQQQQSVPKPSVTGEIKSSKHLVTIALPDDKRAFEHALSQLDAKIESCQAAVDTLGKVSNGLQVSKILHCTRDFWKFVLENPTACQSWGIGLGGFGSAIVFGAAIGFPIGGPGGSVGGAIAGLVIGLIVSGLTYAIEGGGFRPFPHAGAVTPFIAAWDLIRAVVWDLPRKVVNSVSTVYHTVTEGDIARRARTDLATIARSEIPESEKGKIGAERLRDYKAYLIELGEARKALVEYGRKRFELEADVDPGIRYDDANDLRNAFLPLDSVRIVTSRSLASSIMNSANAAAEVVWVTDFIRDNLSDIVEGKEIPLNQTGNTAQSLKTFIAGLSKLNPQERQEKLLELVSFLDAAQEFTN